MALTPEVLFINPDYFKRVTQLSGTIDESWFVPSIILAQDKYVQIYLGTALYEKLKAEVSQVGGPVDPYLTLLDTYVRKVTAWWSMVELIPNLYVQIDNGGLVIRTSENTAAITPNDLNRQVEMARNSAQFYSKQMYRYLCDNSATFPEYSSNSGSQITPEPVLYNQNGYSITRGKVTPYWSE
tara:strand:+ start:1580 stop:2128 length:549 start_codon:yes stop_codon:yes gene_type:complete